jgi:hypothetical protein
VWDNQYKKYITSPNEDEDCDACMGFKFEIEGYYFKEGNIKETRFIFEQFTGLFDKNGKEIYEGDIIELPCLTEPVRGEGTYWKNIKHVVEYDDQSFYPLRLNESVLIGNIHENPELVQKSN